MKELRMLVWLTQTGLSACIPLAGCTLLAVWLKRRFDLGIWIIFAGLILGLGGAVCGLRHSLKEADRMAQDLKSKRH